MTGRRIVVGIDGSAPSIRALAWALREAAWDGASVEVVHSWRPSDAEAAHLSGIEPAIEREKPARQMVQRAVDGALAEMAGDPPTVSLVVTDQSPKRTLCERAVGAELVVVGAQGHGALEGVLTGSVSHHVAAHSPCTVVLVR